MDLPVRITTGEIEVVIVADVVDGVSVRQKKEKDSGQYQFFTSSKLPLHLTQVQYSLGNISKYP